MCTASHSAIGAPIGRLGQSGSLHRRAERREEKVVEEEEVN
jgi:hypothetical protein